MHGLAHAARRLRASGLLAALTCRRLLSAGLRGAALSRRLLSSRLLDSNRRDKAAPRNPALNSRRHVKAASSPDARRRR
ncbi:MAG: hypothetical protein ACK5E1_20045, partial [Bradyrhizobium sp.]|uniref:hypothetical protein n=1 Tax=Bradyrhizobium sp. TaxID=376 RepID=UPI00391DE313